MSYVFVREMLSAVGGALSLLFPVLMTLGKLPTLDDLAHQLDVVGLAALATNSTVSDTLSFVPASILG
jgi:hypothetical protein